jgi:hypothetical protein
VNANDMANDVLKGAAGTDSARGAPAHGAGVNW